MNLRDFVLFLEILNATGAGWVWYRKGGIDEVLKFIIWSLALLTHISLGMDWLESVFTCAGLFVSFFSLVLIVKKTLTGEGRE